MSTLARPLRVLRPLNAQRARIIPLRLPIAGALVLVGVPSLIAGYKAKLASGVSKSFPGGIMDSVAKFPLVSERPSLV